MAEMLFVGGSKHAQVSDVLVDGEVPDKYGDAVGGGYYQQKDAEFIQNHELTGRPQWRYKVTVYVHSSITHSMQNPEQATYQLMADAVLRRWFLEHGEREPVSGVRRPIDDRTIQGNGAGTPAHEEPPAVRDKWTVACVQCGRDEHINERLSGDTLTTDPKVIAEVDSGRDAAVAARTHHEETGHALTISETQVQA